MNKDMIETQKTTESTEDRSLRFMETRETRGHVVEHAVEDPEGREPESSGNAE